MSYLHARREKLGGYLPARHAQSPARCRSPRSIRSAGSSKARRARRIDDDGVRAHALAAAEGPDHRQAHRSDRRRRSAHLRHAVAVPAGRDLFVRRPALRARGPRRAALLQGSEGRPDPRGRHHRSRRDVVVDRRGDTRYSAHGMPMLPFYIFYSMFGFQRVGDFIWAAGRLARARLSPRRDRRPHDAVGRRPAAPGRLEPSRRRHGPELPRLRPVLRLRARGDRAGRRAPHARSAGRRLLLHHGDERELRAAGDARREARGRYLLRGMYRCSARGESGAQLARDVQLLGSGTILREVLAAAEMLEKDFGIAANVWSVTSYTELRRDGMAVERWNTFNATSPQRSSYVEQCLSPTAGPVVAASDYVRAVAGSHPHVGAAPLRRRSAPTASAAATRARRCGASSKSTARRSSSRR